MSQSVTSVIVKVGKKSASRFRNTKVYRAITIDELKSLVEYLNSNIVVIEKINQNEYNKALEFIKEFTTIPENKVYIFTPDNDDDTTGLADELGLNIYLDIKKLYESINNDFGVNLDIDLNVNAGFLFTRFV